MKEDFSTLSIWAKQISPSPTLAVDAKARELKAAGEDVCGFGTGEPDMDTPDFIKEACIKALREGQTKYAPAAGIAKLREALADKCRRINGIMVESPSQVVVSPGGKFSCYLAILATCGPGDEVIVPAPYWVSYPEMVKLAGADPVILPTTFKREFRLSLEDLERVVSERTRLLILNSPSNPTGSVYSGAEIQAIVDFCLERGILLLSDEIYEHLLYDGASHVSPASLSADAAAMTMTVSGFSKTFSMTGWRLGTLVAPPPIAKAAADIQSQMTSNATTFAQYGALAALEHWDQSMAAVAGMLSVFDRRRTAMMDRLTAIPGMDCFRPQGAFYLFPDIAGLGMDGDSFASRILEEEKVALVSGGAFGYAQGLRLSYATSDEVIDKGLSRIERFCKSLTEA